LEGTRYPHAVARCRVVTRWQGPTPDTDRLDRQVAGAGSEVAVQRMTGRGLAVTGAVSCLVAVVVALVVPVGPAQAYGDLTVRYSHVDTDNCAHDGDLAVTATAGGCRMDDPIDGTFFRRDAGGTALKAQLYDGSRLIAKVEFHPYDEVLWVYDTVNDTDTIFVRLCVRVGDTCAGGARGPYSAPSTDNRVDRSVIDLSMGEGDRVTIELHDDAGRTDHIFTSFAIA
jgi:hypothetical protein